MNVEKEVLKIKKRNQRVELDKAWEISWFRKLVIALMTYLIAIIFLYQIKVENYLLSALVPTGGYILSTLSLSPIKKWWVEKRVK